MAELEKQEVKQEEKETKPKQQKQTPPKKKKAPKPLVHIDDFLDAIRTQVTLTSGVESGFRMYMHGNHYLKTYDEFVPYLEKYTNQKIN